MFPIRADSILSVFLPRVLCDLAFATKTKAALPNQNTKRVTYSQRAKALVVCVPLTWDSWLTSPKMSAAFRPGLMEKVLIKRKKEMASGIVLVYANSWIVERSYC